MSQLQGYAKKLNLAIDGVQKKPTEEMVVIKETLEHGFHYLDYMLAFKHVEDQVVLVLKARHGWLQNKIEAREGRPLDVLEAHWNQMKVVLLKGTKIEQAILMTKA